MLNADNSASELSSEEEEEDGGGPFGGGHRDPAVHSRVPDAGLRQAPVVTGPQGLYIDQWRCIIMPERPTRTVGGVPLSPFPL